jgi:hypothetical protein
VPFVHGGSRWVLCQRNRPVRDALRGLSCCRRPLRS